MEITELIQQLQVVAAQAPKTEVQVFDKAAHVVHDLDTVSFLDLLFDEHGQPMSDTPTAALVINSKPTANAQCNQGLASFIQQNLQLSVAEFDRLYDLKPFTGGETASQLINDPKPIGEFSGKLPQALRNIAAERGFKYSIDEIVVILLRDEVQGFDDWSKPIF